MGLPVERHLERHQGGVVFDLRVFAAENLLEACHVGVDRDRLPAVPGHLVHQQNPAVSQFVQPVAGKFHLPVLHVINRIAADLPGAALVHDDRLGRGAELLPQESGHRGQLLNHGQHQRVAVHPEVVHGTVLPAAHVDHLEQPAVLLAGLRIVHYRVEVFGSAPGGQHQSENLLHFLFRNLVAHERAAALDPFEQPFVHQRADRLAHGHIADAEPAGQFLFGRQGGAPGEVADPDLLREPLAGMVRFGQPQFVHRKNSFCWKCFIELVYNYSAFL